jgi:hypothetical protein
MSSTTPPIMLDNKLLSDGLYVLLKSVSTKLSKNFDLPAPSPHELLAWTETLSFYLTQHHSCKIRRSRKPLHPANLAFHVLRTYNPAETTAIDKGKKIKGEKEWYYFILAETEEGTGEVQTLAEGGLREDKEDLMEGFMEAVTAKVGTCEKQNKAKDKAAKERREDNE